jgi:hypothetical protein
MAATTSTSGAILKSQYTQDKVYWIAYKKNPEIATCRKDEAFKGDYKYIAAQIETPQGGGVTVPLAQSHLAPGVYKRFQLARFNDYVVARVSGEALKAAEDDDGALVMLWTREMDGALLTIRRQWGTMFFRNGTGSRGAISSSSNVQTNVIGLTRASDITNFAVGMTIQLAATDGGTLRNSGANAVITAIDRLNSLLYFTNALNSYIAAAATGDFLLREGDNNAVFHGMNAWVPSANIANNDSFLGLNRFPDPVRLAGQWFDATGMTLREMVIEAMARVDVEQAEDIDTVWMHPRDRATLVKELEGKSIYMKTVSRSAEASDDTRKGQYGDGAAELLGEVGYDGIEIEFDGQRAVVMSSINVPRGDCWVGQWDTVGLATLGPFPHILADDTMEYLRVYNDDSLEVRITGRGEMEVLAPAFWSHAVNVGK